MRPVRFTSLLRLESALVLRQPLTWLVFGALALALLVAAANGGGRVAQEGSMFARLKAEQRSAIRLAQEAHVRYSQPSDVRVDYWRDPTSAFGYMNYFLAAHAIKPLTPLGVLATGQSDLEPSHIRINFSSVFPDEAQELRSPRDLQLGSFDLAFVLIYLLPLGLIALSATRVSSEQDSGVLLMIAAQPVSPRKVVAAKFLSVALVSLLLTLLALALALLATGAVGSLGEWSSILAILVAALVAYTFFWIAASAAVATLRKGAVVSMALMVVVWMVVTTLLPAAAALAMDTTAVPPSRINYIDVSRAAMETYTKDPDHVAREWLSKQPSLHATGRDLAEMAEVKRLARDDFYRQSLHSVRGSFDAYQRRVIELADAMRWLSPAMNLQDALQSAAGTDARRHVSFVAQADAYGQALRAFFEPRILRQAIDPKPICDGCSAWLDFTEYDQVPTFVPAFERDRSVGLAMSALAHLLILTAALTALAAVRLRSWRL